MDLLERKQQALKIATLYKHLGYDNYFQRMTDWIIKVNQLILKFWNLQLKYYNFSDRKTMSQRTFKKSLS